jgi:hypothetical protein
MKLVVSAPAVRRVFEITEIDRLIPIHASLTEVLGAEPTAPGGTGGEQR